MATTASCAKVLPLTQIGGESTPHPERDCNHASSHQQDVYYYNNNKSVLDAHIEEIADTYQECYGRRMPENIRTQCRCLICNNHVEPSLISAVIEYSTAAPSPSWRYARFVLNKKIAEGILTEQAWNYSLVSWEQENAFRCVNPLWKKY